MWSNPEKSYFKTGLVSDLHRKRDRMATMLAAAGMKPIIPDSGYFMMADFSPLVQGSRCFQMFLSPHISEL